ADRLRQALGTAPGSLAAAVEEYWQQGEFLAAREAADSDPDLKLRVAARLEQKREDLRAAHGNLLREAEEYRAHDEYVEELLPQIAAALEDLRFEAVAGLFAELEGLVAQARARRDPVRLALQEFLREGGQQPADDALLEELQRQANGLCKEQELRRLHLLE